MRDPQIRYCRTEDGVSIAYTSYGEGPPLVWLVDFPWSHLQMEARLPGVPYNLMRERMVVRFDARGVGLSDREVDDVSTAARCRDIEAVAAALGLNSFDLLAIGFSGPTAIAFATAHSDRVARLVLINSFAAPSRAFRGNTQSRALVQLADVDWEMFSENLAAVTFGWGQAESKAAAEFIRASVTPEMFARMSHEFSSEDFTESLPEVKAETIVVQHAGFKPLALDSGRLLATSIPNARLAVIEGSWQDGPKPVFSAARDFLNEGAISAPADPPPVVSERGGFATILFTDVEGSTALTDHMGDAAARDILREHERITRECLAAHGGSEVKTMGDGFMASFGSATKALECAVAIQKAMVTGDVRVRIGLNAGEPIAEDDPDGRSDLFGTAVNVAARIAAQAKGGEILVSDVVRQLVAGKGFLFNDRGDHALKGFEDPVRVYEVRWQEA